MVSSLSWFSVTSLHSVAGASVAIFLLVQLIKNLPYVRIVPTRVLAMVIGESLQLSVTTKWPDTMGTWVVLFLNGLLTASASIGEWHLLQGTFSVSSSVKKNTDLKV